MDPPLPAAGAPGAAPPGHGRGAASRGVALSTPGLVAPRALPAAPLGDLRAVAHAHRVRRRSRRAAGGRRRAVRALGGAEAMISSPVIEPIVLAPDATELTRLAKAHAFAL